MRAKKMIIVLSAVISLVGIRFAHAVTTEQLGDDALIPVTATSDNQTDALNELKSITLDQQFLGMSSKTTALGAIKTPSAVEDLTFDAVGIARLVFKESVNLTTPQAIALLKELNTHLEIEPLAVTIDDTLYAEFDSPVEITFYKVPFVWDPAIERDRIVLEAKQIQRYTRTTIDDLDVISFIVSQPGAYRLVPKVDLLLENESTVRRTPLNVNGRVSDPAARVKVTVNTDDLDQTAIVLDQKTGEFTVRANLLPGSNIIIARAESALGEAAPVSKLVYYEQPATPAAPERTISPLVFLAAALIIVAIGLVLAVRLSRR